MIRTIRINVKEIQTETRLYWHDDSGDDDKKKNKPITYMPNMDHPFEIIPDSGVFCERLTKDEVRFCSTKVNESF